MKPAFYSFSNHAIGQIAKRGLSTSIISMVMANPDRTFFAPGDVMIFQKIVYEPDKPYLYRVFVNIGKTPPLIITVYKTSKINRYEDKI